MLPFNRCDIPLPFPDPEAGDLAGFVGVPFVGVPAFTQATPDGPTAETAVDSVRVYTPAGPVARAIDAHRELTNVQARLEPEHLETFYVSSEDAPIASLAPRHVASAPAPQQMAAPPVAAASPTAGVPQQVVATNQQMAAAPQIAAASPAPQQLVAPPQAAALEQLVAPGQQIAASPEQMAAAPQMVAAEQPSVSDGKRPRPAREVLNGLSLNFLFYHFIHYQQQAELLALSTAKINSLILRIHPVHPSTVEGLRLSRRASDFNSPTAKGVRRPVHDGCEALLQAPLLQEVLGQENRPSGNGDPLLWVGTTTAEPQLLRHNELPLAAPLFYQRRWASGSLSPFMGTHQAGLGVAFIDALPGTGWAGAGGCETEGKRRLAPEAGWGHPAPQAAPQTPFRSPLQLRLPETLRSGDDGQLRVLFLMGLPGAGKSTVKRQRLRPDDLDIEPDQMKRRHHLFSEDMGEETDEEVHCWSVRRSVDAFEDAVRRRRRSILFDSSGSNASWLQRRIELAQRKGYVTELLWVDVPVEIALYRNRGRGFQNNRRGQFCPEHIILNKAKVLERSFQELSRYVCVAERMKNWCEGSYELEEAKEDLYLYPAPRTRPPALRPGMKHYGEAPDGARPPSPSAGSRRKLQIGPWKRNDEVTQKKNARLAWMDHTYHGDREYYVDKHVLGSRDILLERNKFPYQLPPGAEHWTIWSRKPMDHDELCDYVEGWLDAREPHHVVSWNYDDNRGRRTINIWHIHIYFQGRGGRPPRLTCPSEASEARGADEDRSSEPSAKRRRTVHTERRTDCIKTPSVHLSPSLKRSPCGV
ncbi:Hypothetical protein SCF082_LOCUS16183 [Durusdinium trenchii]|uniref:Zeta toxin domain-containing protein n=1 Tax=Durusdinium trenchii TaxID=1381693 RepID=A0ABP0K9X1_9DINO